MTNFCIGAAQEQLLLPCLLQTADCEGFCACLSDFAGVDMFQRQHAANKAAAITAFNETL